MTEEDKQITGPKTPDKQLEEARNQVDETFAALKDELQADLDKARQEIKQTINKEVLEELGFPTIPEDSNTP